MKLSAEVNIGSLGIGAVAFYPVQSVSDLRRLPGMMPWIGLTAMVRLF